MASSHDTSPIASAARRRSRGSPRRSAAASSSTVRASASNARSRAAKRADRRSPMGKGSGSGAAPRSCSTVNTAGSSTSASGLPCVASTMRRATVSSTGTAAAEHRRSTASGPGSPARSSRRRPSKRTAGSGISRTATSIATRSARRRRPTNDSAVADSSSSHCASSTTIRTDWSRAASATRLSTARPARNGSSASCCTVPRTASSAARWGSGRWRADSRIGSTSWCTPA